MCGASKLSDRHIDHKDAIGEHVTVQANKYGQGALVPKGETVESCTACLRGDQQPITIAGIPEAVRKEYGFKDDVVVGRFIEIDTPDHRTARDLVAFDQTNIPPVDLADLQGAHVYIGVAVPGSEEYAELCNLAGIEQGGRAPAEKEPVAA